jgi:hypothetical protein
VDSSRGGARAPPGRSHGHDLAHLEELCGFASADALVAAKQALDPRSIPTILPLMQPGGVSLDDLDEHLVIVG